MPDCSKHKKEIAGISDMKVLAKMIGDLHYETLAKLLKELAKKVKRDSLKDFNGGRTKLGFELLNLSSRLNHAEEDCYKAWKISKPFMEEKNKQS